MWCCKGGVSRQQNKLHMSGEETSADRNVEIRKIKKLIKSLEMARGNGTVMISLIIPPKDQIPKVSKMLADEFRTTFTCQLSLFVL